jgi:phenylacetate-CoA ligase
MYRWLAQKIMAPSHDILRGTHSMKCWRELEASQWWPREQIIELQNQRLKRLVHYAYENVPYYRRIFDRIAAYPEDIKSGDDLTKLPILNKHDIRTHFEELTARDFPPLQRIRLHTSGSTGQQLYFYSTKQQHISLAFAERQRGYHAIGFKLGDKYAYLDDRIQHISGPEILQRLIGTMKRELFLDIRRILKNEFHDVAAAIKRYNPQFMRGFPSTILDLARFIRNNPEYSFKLSGIISGGETLYAYQRDYFREVFGCDTFDFYGTEEQHIIGVECPLHSGYHLAAEDVIVEIIDSNGKPVPAGSEGEITITALNSYAMPFIRYRIGDIGVISGKTCPCGRGLPLLDSLSGRIYDSIITKSRRVIPGQYLVRLISPIYTRLNMEEFQIVQEIAGQVIIRVVLDKDSRQEPDEISTALIRGYKDMFGEEIDVNVEIVDKITRSARGKLRKVLSHLPVNDF